MKILDTIKAIAAKQAVRLSALVLALSLVGGYTVFAIAEKVSTTNTAEATEKVADKNNNEKISDQINDILDNMNADKQETVYVIAKADGTVKKVIVSELLKNSNSEKTITDKTDLKDVKNVKNNNGYTMDGDSYVWDAEGEDVYYQGTSEKALPVDLSINFTLDGANVSPDALAGKSGKLEITFNYTNNEYKTVSIDGKDEKIYVPFAMLSGLILDNDKCKNVTVSNGRVMSDGDRSIAVGFALPGMQENLDLSKDDLDIPSSVTITADVTDFELETTLTLASNDLFNSVNLDDISTYDDLKEDLKTLDDSAEQLVDGTSTLYTGISTLLEKSGTLVNGVQALAAATQKLSSVVSTLSDGATKLDGGISALYSGLGTLNGKSDELIGGAKQVFETLLSTADTQIAAAGLKIDKLTIDNYKDVLKKAIDSLDENAVKKLAEQTALAKVTEQVKANEPTIKAAVEQTVQQKVLAGVLQTMGMTVDQYNTALAAGQITDAVKAQVEGAVAQQMATDAVKAQITAAVAQQEQTLIDQNMASDTVQNQIKAAIEQAKAGKTSLSDLLNQLNSYDTFYQGVNQYTDSVKSAYDGSKDLKDGATKLDDGALQLKNGAEEMLSGVLKLSNGSVTLIDGVKQLKTGSLTLSDGMQKFYDDGISKLTNTFNGDIDSLVTRLRATADVSKDYESYAGKSDDMSGTTKFIYRTESIKKK